MKINGKTLTKSISLPNRECSGQDLALPSKLFSIKRLKQFQKFAFHFSAGLLFEHHSTFLSAAIIALAPNLTPISASKRVTLTSADCALKK